LISQEPSEIPDGQEMIVVRANRPKRKLEVDIDLSLPRGKRSCVLKHANVAAPVAPAAPSRKRGQRGPGKKVKDIKDTEIIKKTTALNKEVTLDQQYLLI
jgi:hypothetical protein